MTCGVFEETQLMKLYAISGLGADHRVFDYLSLNLELEVLPWLDPESSESLESYVRRMALKIDTSEPFGLIGVSFGGIVVVELNKIINPEFSILISSVVSKDEVPTLYRLVGKIGLLKWLPLFLFNPPRVLAHWLFGAKNKALLTAILDDTDLRFAKWATQRIATWNSTTETSNLIRVHGTSDRILPLPKHASALKIDNGTHFMIVDRANEVSTLINRNTPQQRI